MDVASDLRERQFQLRHSRSRACLGNQFTAVLADFLPTLEGARRSLTRAATLTSNPDNNRHGPNFSAKERASWRLLHIQPYEKWLPIDAYSGFMLRATKVAVVGQASATGFFVFRRRTTCYRSDILL